MRTTTGAHELEVDEMTIIEDDDPNFPRLYNRKRKKKAWISASGIG